MRETDRLAIIPGVNRASVQPVLRWAGSKRTLLPTLIARLPGGVRYYEPFAGSACLFFATQPRDAVLGDLNPDLVAFYRTLRSQPREVAARVHEWAIDSDTYYGVRALDPTALDAASRAARFLYLNRLCFNGVYRTDRRGRFNVPYGRRPGAIPGPPQLRRCATLLRRSQLRCGDFEMTTADARPGDVVYLDPPYTQTPERAYGVYGYGSFDARDLDRMLDFLEALDRQEVRFLFSYADVPAVEQRLRPSWSLHRIQTQGRVAANVTSRTTRHEILLTNAFRTTS